MSISRPMRVRWTTREKFNLVYLSWGLKGFELGRFLRLQGLHLCDLKGWLEQMQEGLEKDVVVTGNTKKYFRNKILKLEKELVEARAIIEAQKKVQQALGAKGASTMPKPEKLSLKSSTKRQLKGPG